MGHAIRRIAVTGGTVVIDAAQNAATRRARQGRKRDGEEERGADHETTSRMLAGFHGPGVLGMVGRLSYRKHRFRFDAADLDPFLYVVEAAAFALIELVDRADAFGFA